MKFLPSDQIKAAIETMDNGELWGAIRIGSEGTDLDYGNKLRGIYDRAQMAIHALLDPAKGEQFSDSHTVDLELRKEGEYLVKHEIKKIYRGRDGAKEHLAFAVSDGFKELLGVETTVFPAYEKFLDVRYKSYRLDAEQKKREIEDTSQVWELLFEKNKNAQHLNEKTLEIRSYIRSILEREVVIDDLEKIEELVRISAGYLRSEKK